MEQATEQNYITLKENIKKELTNDEYIHLINTVEQIDFKDDKDVWEKKCLTLYVSYQELLKQKK